MHAFRCYIFAARIACDSGPTCFSHYRPLVICQFSLKTGDLFLLITRFTRGSPIFPAYKNLPLLWEALFLGGLVRPNMLNMPKSAAGGTACATFNLRDDSTGLSIVPVGPTAARGPRPTVNFYHAVLTFER